MHPFGSLIELSCRLKNAEKKMTKIFNRIDETHALGYIEIIPSLKNGDAYFKNNILESMDNQKMGDFSLDESQKVTSTQELIIKNSTKAQHRCHYCPYFCDSRFHLRRHISSVHNGEKSYRCYVCAKEFSRSEKVKQHFLNIHPDVTYEAKKTRKAMLSIDELEAKLQRTNNKAKPADNNKSPHASVLTDIDSDRAWSKFCQIQSTFSNNAFACVRCSYSGTHIWQMKAHYLNTHTQTNAYTCRVCHYVAYKFERLVGHMQGHGELYCIQCSFSSTDVDEYTLHTNTCSTARTCDMCASTHLNAPTLQKHYTSEHNKLLYVCKLCVFASVRVDDMQQHELTHKPTRITDSPDGDVCARERVHTCTFKDCAFTSVWKKCLELHTDNFHKSPSEISAPGFFPPCPFCPSYRTFKYKKSFEKHLMQHGLKPIQCAKFMTGFYAEIE